MNPLSEQTPATATQRSPEDQDLLERSTKKPKHARGAPMASPHRPTEVDMQDSPVASGGATPDSSQWTTPAATPNQAWAQSKNAQMMDRDEVADGERMETLRNSSGYPIFLVTEEEKERLRRPWRRSLIIRVLGRTVGYNYLLQRLQRMWKPEAVFDLIEMNNGFFLAKFESLHDYGYAKYEGPWMILDHYLVVQEWEPNFDTRCDQTRKILVWIRFPDMPVEYFEEEFLMKIGRDIGRPIKIDTTTSLVSKAKFARMCIEMDITKPLLSKYVLDEKEWLIEYEGFHLVCFKCGTYGHRHEQCETEKPRPEGDTTDQDNNESTRRARTVINQTPPEKYGYWMLVTKQKRGNRPRTQNQNADVAAKYSTRFNNLMFDGTGSQSRFAPLQDFGEPELNQDKAAPSLASMAQTT
ncbi:uncharacterized protein LOC116001370 [Ipomoea triloba]|uniref:uncharacterized protein LOC116001370 n=1 Tax=Ipomoea triloba TaxID=35885 RepID=UPI00125E31A6|nr:uncharacterized protein LOC116001370 [Ipomoea triloba]